MVLHGFLEKDEVLERDEVWKTWSHPSDQHKCHPTASLSVLFPGHLAVKSSSFIEIPILFRVFQVPDLFYFLREGLRCDII